MATDPVHTSDPEVTLPELGEAEPSLAAGTVLAGRYRVERVIGEGGMGEVYLARHLTIDKLLAIKVLSPERARRPRTVSRFLQEAKASSKIRHENVVDITDFGKDDGRAFFVMEYLDGEDLSAILKRGGRMPWQRARAIIIQVLEALTAAHQASIIHRDIKPHNIFIIAREHNPEFVKLIDFGIAKLRDGSEEALTQTGAIMGTADYMSPEQGQGMDLDGRSDLYSVGVILYRMLTGGVPFKAGNAMATVYLHVHTEAVPPSQACPEAEISPELDALVLRALAKKPEERFSSAAEFIAALRAVDGHNRRGVGTGTVVAAVVACVLVLTVGLAFAYRTFVQTEAPEAEPEAQAVAAVEPEAQPEPVVEEPEPEPALEPETVAAEPEPKPEPVAVVEPKPEPKPEPALPARRSSRDVSTALDKVADKVSACGKKGGLFPGEKVGVSLSIAPSGKIQKVKVTGMPAAAGISCVTKAVKRAKLEPVSKGQSAKHRFTI
ncbi:MAG: serine/threonine-protein kinase [Myxococcota bacterium]